MKLDIISFNDLNHLTNNNMIHSVLTALLRKGLIGIIDIPNFEKKSRAYIKAARDFSALPDSIQRQYMPDRDAGNTEGYELGAEKFKNTDGVWQIDDKKASFYAFVPDHTKNKWPTEIDLKTPYLELGELIFATGKLLLNLIGLNEEVGLKHADLVGYGRMLHYHKEEDHTNDQLNWCGAHFDHGVFTGLIPAYYFKDGVEIDEPDEAGLLIMPSDSTEFVKIHASDKRVLIFQVGEFAQLISNDRIKATKHLVRKAHSGVERFTFALFYSASNETVIQSHSKLIEDDRYHANRLADGSVSYAAWQKASFARYRA